VITNRAEGQAQLAKLLRNAEGKSVRRPDDLPEAGARASHADRIRRERCGGSALRSVPAINDRLAALEELDQIALLT